MGVNLKGGIMELNTETITALSSGLTPGDFQFQNWDLTTTPVNQNWTTTTVVQNRREYVIDWSKVTSIKKWMRLCRVASTHIPFCSQYNVMISDELDQDPELLKLVNKGILIEVVKDSPDVITYGLGVSGITGVSGPSAY